MESQFHNAYAHYPYYPPFPPPPPPHFLPPLPPPPPPHLQSPNPPSNTSLHPPGVDSYYQQHYNQPATHVGSYCSSSQVGALHTANHYQDPNIAQSWGPNDAVRTYGDSLHPHANYASVSPMLPAGENLETKSRKLLEGGAAIDSIMRCYTCNVICNGPKVYNQHIAGKKHAIQAAMRPPTTAVPANPIPNYFTDSVAQPPLKKAKKKKAKNARIVQSAWCEICSIGCTDQDTLNNHKMGKKHQKKLKKLKEQVSTSSETTNNRIIASQENSSSTNPVSDPQGNTSSNNLIISPQENPLSNNVEAPKGKLKADEEDLETKRQRVVSGGVAVEEVRVCEVCSVVCNNQMIFKYHLAGKRHVKMVKKQAEATLPPAAQVVNIA